MAVNLKKIRADLNHGDPQIQTFALMSITRLSPQLVDTAEEIQAVYDKLQRLVHSDNPDVVFLARKATNHIDSVFRPYFQQKGPAAGGRMADPRELDREALLRTLSPELEPTYLASVVMRFAQAGQPEDLSAVKPYLSHEDDRVRSNAVEVFQVLGGPEHVPLLLPLLKDRNNRVRGNAVMALVALGYRDVRRVLEEMLCMGMISMRETAVYVLSRIDLPFVEELLLKASADPYDGVRIRAARALGAFVTRRSIIRLKQLMNDIDINVCEAAVDSLKRIKAAHERAKSGKGTPGTGGAQEPVRDRQEMVEAAAADDDGTRVSDRLAAAESPGASTEDPPGHDAAEASGSGSSGIRHPASAIIDESEIDSPEAVSADGQVVPVAQDEPPMLRPADSSGVPGAGARESRREELLRDIGTEIYQLCRMNEITHEKLDNVFYEILRYQDFLRAYLVKKQQGGVTDVDPRAAIEQLQAKIKQSFAELGRCAVELVRKGAVRIPGEYESSVARAMGELASIEQER